MGKKIISLDNLSRFKSKCSQLFQEKLIAGTGISIAQDGKTISATGGDDAPLVLPIYNNDGGQTWYIDEAKLTKTLSQIYADHTPQTKYLIEVSYKESGEVVGSPEYFAVDHSLKESVGMVLYSLSAPYVMPITAARSFDRIMIHIYPQGTYSVNFARQEVKDPKENFSISIGKDGDEYVVTTSQSYLQEIFPKIDARQFNNIALFLPPEDDKEYFPENRHYLQRMERISLSSLRLYFKPFVILLESDGSTTVSANTDDVLRLSAQALTDAQKAQVLTNLGLTTENWTITYDDETTETITIVKKV